VERSLPQHGGASCAPSDIWLLHTGKAAGQEELSEHPCLQGERFLHLGYSVHFPQLTLEAAKKISSYANSSTPKCHLMQSPSLAGAVLI